MVVFYGLRYLWGRLTEFKTPRIRNVTALMMRILSLKLYFKFRVMFQNENNTFTINLIYHKINKF